MFEHFEKRNHQSSARAESVQNWDYQMKHHILKIRREFFNAVMSGEKTFEIRKDDRNFRQGDTLTLLEIETDPKDHFTGRSCNFRIGFVSDYAQTPGFVVFSLIK